MKKIAKMKKESFFENAEDALPHKIEKKDEEASTASEKNNDSLNIEETSPPKSKGFVNRFITKKYISITFGVILIGVVALGGFYLYQKQNEGTEKSAKLADSQIQSLIDEVAEKIMLPQGETPTIATVTDITKLADQPFFRNAQNGDKVIIYGSTNEAILYRTSIHKIIAVAPINSTGTSVQGATAPPQIENATATPSVSLTLTPVEKLKVIVLNSTKEAGLAKKGANLLDKEKYVVVSTSNAKGEYEKTIVASVNKENATDSDLRSIISFLSKIKASVAPLPEEEVKPANADVVIILGSDFSEEY